MKDALGGVQSVLVLGGGSEIALATVRKLIEGRLPAPSCSRAATPRRSAPPPRSSKPPARPTSTRRRSTPLDYASHDCAFVDDVFARAGDFDLVVLAFGVLGDQELAEATAPRRAGSSRRTSPAPSSVAVPLVQRARGQGHGTVVRALVGRRRAGPEVNFVYGSSKAGLDGFCQGLGDRLAGTGVRVVIVRPGFVRTKMTAGMEPAPLATDAGRRRRRRSSRGSGAAPTRSGRRAAALGHVGAAPPPPPGVPPPAL